MAKNYKCPYCEKRLIRKDLITHINKSHKDLIPENYTAARLVYNIANKTEYGRCRVCGKETQWSEKNGRYNVLCGSSKCKEYMREEYKKNMLRVKGTYNILNDPEQQKIMLANRSISGKYKFQDGGEHIFTGSYEKKCLEFMDIVMQISSDDIMSPGPTLEYEYNGQKHFYIADFYYIPYNLIIEVKDGGDNINTKDSASMRASREKTIEKERIITDKGEYNYIRLTNNNFAQLIEVFMDIKEKLLRGDDSKTYKINESQIILEDYFVDKKDIYYNKDKFDSGEINLCFITGLAGSGKTTMGKTMQSGNINIEVYALDDIISNWDFSDANLKEYGDLVYSFFKGPGKMYRYTSYDEWMNDSKWDNPTNPYANSYDAMIIKDFVKYAKSYANSHKNIKFVLEGVWVFYFIDPKELDSYAVYIKGASALISFIRAAKRDCQDANSNMEKFGAFIKVVTSIGRMKAYLSSEKRLLRFYEYFASKVINESQVVLENTNISDIRNVINKIHQKYLKDKKPPTGNQNCLLCTWCVESWFRGINVLPRPIYSPTDIAFKFNGYDIVKNPELIKFRSKEDFKRIIYSSGNGSRYYVHVKWNGGSGGHEFMAIDVDNIIYTIDAQQGIIENMDTSYVVKDYFNINYDESYMVRLDNKQFNKELLKYNDNKYIKQLTEDDMKMLEENAIDESLEDISGVVFGKRKLIQDKYITLYHGTSIKDLPWISPLSINVGLKNANPKMSSFWFNNLDYAITFSTMDYIARNLNDKDICRSMVLDNDMKVLIDNKYKSKIIASIKNGESYVYERTIESKYVGYGHNGVFPEYTLDIPVKPDRYYVIKFKDMVSKIKFVSESYIKSIKQKYADGKMDFGNNKMQLLMDRVFYYSGHNDRVDKTKQAKAYNKISLNDILYLNKMLNQYEYIIPNNGNIITQVSEDSFNKYKLLSPDEFKKYKGGICWDYVVYEAYWFDKYFTNIPYSVYFEVLDNKIDCPTHTFLIFEYGGKYYWFESSWKPMCGIYGGFDTEKDAVDYVMSKLNDNKSNYKNYICKYDPLDSKMFGMNSKQFMDYLLPKVKPYKFPNKVIMPTTVIKGTIPEHKSY